MSHCSPHPFLSYITCHTGASGGAKSDAVSKKSAAGRARTDGGGSGGYKGGGSGGGVGGGGGGGGSRRSVLYRTHAPVPLPPPTLPECRRLPWTAVNALRVARVVHTTWAANAAQALGST